MRFSAGRKLSALFASLLFIMLAAGGVSSARPPASFILPNPVLVLAGQNVFETGGKQFTRYNYYVDNFADFPNELFAASPDLPPCGKNTKASRTWIDFYD